MLLSDWNLEAEEDVIVQSNRTVYLQNRRILGSKTGPVTDLEWSSGFQEFKVPRFRDNGTGWW